MASCGITSQSTSAAIPISVSIDNIRHKPGRNLSTDTRSRVVGEKMPLIEIHKYIERVCQTQPQQQRDKGCQQQAEKLCHGRPIVYAQKEREERYCNLYNCACTWLCHLLSPCVTLLLRMSSCISSGVSL